MFNKNMGLEDKTQKVIIGNESKKQVTIVIEPLTQNEARQMFPYRPDTKYSESRFGGNELCDDIALLLNGSAERCKMCGAPTRKKYLNPNCPDCDGRSEYNGTNPRAKIQFKLNVLSSTSKIYRQPTKY